MVLIVSLVRSEVRRIRNDISSRWQVLQKIRLHTNSEEIIWRFKEKA